MFFYIQLVCLNGSKMRPRSHQVDTKMASLAVMLAYIGALDRHLGSTFLQSGFQEASRWSLERVLFDICLGSSFPWPIFVAICDQIAPNLGSSSPKFHQTASINTPRAHKIDFLISDPSKLNFQDFNKHSDQQGLHS